MLYAVKVFYYMTFYIIVKYSRDLSAYLTLSLFDFLKIETRLLGTWRQTLMMRLMNWVMT